MDESRLLENPLVYRPYRRLSYILLVGGLLISAAVVLIARDTEGLVFALLIGEIPVIFALLRLTKQKLILGPDYVMFVDLVGRRTGPIPFEEVYRVESSERLGGDVEWLWRLETKLGPFTLDGFEDVDGFIQELQARAPSIRVKKYMTSNR